MTGPSTFPVEHDAEADAVYIRTRPQPSPGSIVRTEELFDGVLVDLDKDGRIIGIEILDASKRLDGFGRSAGKLAAE